MIENLKITIKFFVKFIILIIITLSFSKNILSQDNRIIFKINDHAFTSLDLEKRKKYLDFVGNNSDLNQDTIINDFISANIFYEYYNNLNNKENFENKVLQIYENIIEINANNKKQYKYRLVKENLLYNIKIDFIRKNILEKILNSNFKNINKSKEIIDLLYNFKIIYINFYNQKNSKIFEKINSLIRPNEKDIKKILSDNKIDYFIKESEVNNIFQIDERIKNNIISNKDFLVIKNNNLNSLILIKRRFETLDGIIANLYSVKSKYELEINLLKCENLSNHKDKFNIVNKEYYFKELNDDLKNNLININDNVKFFNDDEYIYVILCDIKFDQDILNNINLNKVINSNVGNIEKNFISKYSKIYNLIKNEI